MTKIMGDKIMACFDEGKADSAIEASIAILQDMERFRLMGSNNAASRFLYTGIGLSQGCVIEGNIGSSAKKDYTLMGDTVNLAARLESMTRILDRPIVFSESIANQISRFSVESLGSHPIKGKQDFAPLFSTKECISFSYDKIKQRLNLIPSGDK